MQHFPSGRGPNRESEPTGNQLQRPVPEMRKVAPWIDLTCDISSRSENPGCFALVDLGRLGAWAPLAPGKIISPKPWHHRRTILNLLCVS